MSWRVELFGGPRLLSPRGEVFSRFSTQKAAGLLAYLAITLPRTHLRDVLIERFWPDKDPVLSRNSLSAALSTLRPILGEALITGRLRVGLDPACIVTDLAEFEAALAGGDIERARQLSALEFLPGFYDDWVVLERERLAACLETASPAHSKHHRPAHERHNLPEPLVSFIGRGSERRELTLLLEKARLVTLTGSGGSGKTRLSQYVARDVLERFEQGVWLIPLAPLADPALVIYTVAAILDIKEVPGKSMLTTLIQTLRDKEMLLLLDNCEHVLETSASVAESLLQSCPLLRILATSREALGVAGELPYRIPSLAPDDAIQLFVERATQQRPRFVQTEQNTPALTAICTRLDGIPLAIELAAARLRTLSLEELSLKLNQSLTLLTGGPRTVLPRHQTLRGLIDWSYNLLTESEKALLCRLSVFAGGWRLDAAERVCSGEEIEEGAVLDGLTSLVDKSLVIVDSEQPDTTRYRLLETVRQYAQERLQECGTEDVQAVHLEYFRAFCEASFPRQFQADAVSEFHRVEQEHDNIRGALQFGTSASDESLQRKAMEIAGLLRRFWYIRSHLQEARQWYKTILSLPVAREPGDAQGQCLIGAATLARAWGHHDEAEALFVQCVTEQRALENDLNVAIALCSLAALVSELQGDQKKGLAYMRESLVFAQKADNLNIVAQATINIGTFLVDLGDKLEAHEMLEKGLTLARRQGNKALIAAALGNLGMLAYQSGEYSKACKFGRENLEICQEFGRNFPLAVAFNYIGVFTQGAGDLTISRHYRKESLQLSQQLNGPVMCIVVLRGLAELDELEGHYERAGKLLGAVSALRKMHEANIASSDELLSKLRTALSDAALNQAFEEGNQLSLPEAIALATTSPL